MTFNFHIYDLEQNTYLSSPRSHENNHARLNQMCKKIVNIIVNILSFFSSRANSRPFLLDTSYDCYKSYFLLAMPINHIH